MKAHGTPHSSSAPAGESSGGPGGSAWPWIGVGLLVALSAAIAAWLLAARAVAGDPVAELERAFRRTGRPLSPGTTLVTLENRFRGVPEAAGYVRALRTARYGGGPGLEPQHRTSGRRAVRRELAGRGLVARMRALWALPPEPPRRPDPS